MAIEIDVDIQSAPPNISDAHLQQLIARVADTALREEGWSRAEVSIRITDDQEVRTLNRMYRDMDESTDVLSFPLITFDDDEALLDNEEEIPPLGDIVISWQRAVSQADEYGHTRDREFAFLVVHGLLHLLGYDHEDETSERIMQQRQKAILSLLNINR